MQRILLVEDNQRLADHVLAALKKQSLYADVCQDKAAALHTLAAQQYGVLILDRGLPDGDGLSLLKQLRQRGNMLPCLVLTAQSTIHDRVQGLDNGADDYLAKPFSMDELIARVKALLRRPTQTISLDPCWQDLELRMQHAELCCAKDGVEYCQSLAPAEVQIMALLMQDAQHGSRVRRRQALEHAAWGVMDAVTPNALDVVIHRLRKKLSALGSVVVLTNIRGVGYQLQTETMHAS